MEYKRKLCPKSQDKTTVELEFELSSLIPVPILTEVNLSVIHS